MLLSIQLKLQLLRKNTLRSSLAFSLILLGIVSIATPVARAARMSESAIQSVSEIPDVVQSRLDRAKVIEAFINDNPLPENASEADIERYAHYNRVRESLIKQAEDLGTLHNRLSIIVSGSRYSGQQIVKFNEIVEDLERRVERSSNINLELVPASRPEPVEVAAGTTDGEIEKPVEVKDEGVAALEKLEEDMERPVWKRSPGARNRRERREARRQARLELERERERESENEQTTATTEDGTTDGASLELSNNGETGTTGGEVSNTPSDETLRQRRALESLADVENQADEAARQARERRRVEEEQRRIEQRKAAEALADVEYQADQARIRAEENRANQEVQSPPETIATNDDNGDPLDETRAPAGGRSQVDPFMMESPPYRATPGRIWVRDAETKRWGLISDGEFISRRKERLREKYSGALGRKLPVNKSIRVLDLNKGRERWLKANRDYEIQVVGFAPRGMIRVKVFDKDGNEVPGDFVTMKFNVERGTEAAAARDALNALRKIRDAGHIENACRVAPAQPDDINDAINDGTGEVQDDGSIEPYGYKPGCRALADGITESDRAQLRQCMSSILDFIKAGANRCDQMERMFSLKEKEQDFAALLMTTKGEAPGGLPAGSPDHLMIMKSLDNRKKAVSWWGPPLSVMDIALQPWQYSMFNDWDKNGRFDGNNFLRNASQYNTLIDSLITYQNADWQPPGTIDDITHYYSPPAMVPKNSQPRWVSHNRNGTEREVTNQIRVNGQPVVNRSNSSSGYHRFYTGIDGRANYSARRKSRDSILRNCRR